MNRFLFSLVTLAAGIALAGCSKHFDIKTAPGLVELDDQEPDYGYRAMTPEGVVTAVKVIDTNEQRRPRVLDARHDAAHAPARRLRAARHVRREDPQRDAGARAALRTRRGSKPYLYVAARLRDERKRLFLVETGGPQAEMERYQGALDWMQATLKLD